MFVRLVVLENIYKKITKIFICAGILLTGFIKIFTLKLTTYRLKIKDIEMKLLKENKNNKTKTIEHSMVFCFAKRTKKEDHEGLLWVFVY